MQCKASLCTVCSTLKRRGGVGPCSGALYCSAAEQFTAGQQSTVLQCSRALYCSAAGHCTAVQQGRAVQQNTLLQCSRAVYCRAAEHCTAVQQSRGNLPLEAAQRYLGHHTLQCSTVHAVRQQWIRLERSSVKCNWLLYIASISGNVSIKCCTFCRNGV